MTPRPDARRTAYNWIYRLLDDRTKAKAMLGRLPEECLKGTPVETLGPIRRLFRIELDDAAFGATLFGHPGDALVDLPALDPLPAGARPGEVPDPRERFAPAVRGVIELGLVDRIPLEAIAAHLEVGPDMVRSFLASVVDVLGDLSSIPVGEGASHVTHVIQEEILAHQGLAPPADPSLDPVAQLRLRVREVLAVLGHDKRILSMSSDQLVRKALAAPRAQVSDRRSWLETAFKGLTPRPAPHAEGEAGEPGGEIEPAPPSRGLPWKPVLTGGGALALIAGLILFEGLGPAAPASAKVRGGDPSKVLGTFSTPGHRRQPLTADSRLEAPPTGPLAISFFAGISVVGRPPSALKIQPGAVELDRGEFRVWTEWPLKSTFMVKIRNLRIEMTGGSLEIRIDSQGAVRVTGVKGRSILSEPADQTREIGPADRLELTFDGKLTFVAAPP